MSHAVNRIELADLIDYVAQQLTEADQRAGGRSGRIMSFTECELELAVSVEREAGAGIKVWLLELGGSQTKANSHVIRVKCSALPEVSTAFFAGGRHGPSPVLGED